MCCYRLPVHCSFSTVAACTFWYDRSRNNVLLRCFGSSNVICQNDKGVLLGLNLTLNFTGKLYLMPCIHKNAYTKIFKPTLYACGARANWTYMTISRYLFKAKALWRGPWALADWLCWHAGNCLLIDGGTFRECVDICQRSRPVGRKKFSLTLCKMFEKVVATSFCAAYFCV